jgi:hypothetical protein
MMIPLSGWQGDATGMVDMNFVPYEPDGQRGYAINDMEQSKLIFTIKSKLNIQSWVMCSFFYF